MKVLIQRVKKASVEVDEKVVGDIKQGLLVFVGVEPNDGQEEIAKLVKKIIGYRIFSDEQDKINLNVEQINGQLLLVSQFTLCAQTNKGLRPGFSSAASPEHAEKIFNEFVAYTKSQFSSKVDTGVFGADMQVSLVNDGPMTFWLSS